MKRKPALLALSREHHKALCLAKYCKRAVQSCDSERISKACQRAVNAFANELAPHFKLEEQQFLPLLQGAKTQALLLRTLSDHLQLREALTGLRQDDAGVLHSFGDLLESHVRFEERELFPALESFMP